MNKVRKQSVTEKPKSLRSRLSSIKRYPSKRSIGKFLLLWFVPMLVFQSFLLRDFLAPSNYVEALPSELILPTITNALTALLVAACLFFIKRPGNFGAKLFSSTVLGLLLTNYDERLMRVADPIRAIVPVLPAPDNDIVIISLLFFGLLLALAILAGIAAQRFQGRYKQLHTSNMVGATLILVGIIFGGQVVAFVGMLPTIIRESRVVPTELQKPNGNTNPERPDVYYIVLDRYANGDVLREQVGYDNSRFTDGLRDSGFVVNDSAYANYPFTTISISSTLNAQYTNDYVAPFKNENVQPRTLYHNLIYQSSVIKAFKDAGYTYHNVGSWYGASNRAPLADHNYIWKDRLTIFGKSKILRGMEGIEFSKSIFYRFAKLGGVSKWPLKHETLSQIDEVRTQLSVLNSLSTTPSSGGRFIFSHILVPHPAYYFNADGSLNPFPLSDHNSQTNKQKYQGQLEFINTQMEKLVTNVKQQSKDKAVIILNADEGPYPEDIIPTLLQPNLDLTNDGSPIDYVNMPSWTNDWLRIKYGVLQAAHIPAAMPADMESLSSVNVFRIVLNRYLGYDLDYLPQCHYGFTKGAVFHYNYADITEKLTGNNNPECKQFESLPSR